MKRVTSATLPDAKALLERRPQDAMFILSNLDRYGLDGEAPRAVAIWADDRRLLAVTNEGMVFPFGGDLASAATPLLHGRSLIGMIGPTTATRETLHAVGLQNAPTTMDADEPQFCLDLDALRVPGTPGRLVPLTEAPRALMEEWRVAYDVEALGATEDAARARIGDVVDGYIAADSHRVLVIDGQPVCTTGFNATQPNMVQVGGVYTPPALRKRGYAARAVALHLAEARDRNVTHATLFAASDDAGRVYERIGFERCGRFALVLFDGAQVARG